MAVDVVPNFPQPAACKKSFTQWTREFRRNQSTPHPISNCSSTTRITRDDHTVKVYSLVFEDSGVEHWSGKGSEDVRAPFSMIEDDHEGHRRGCPSHCFYGRIITLDCRFCCYRYDSSGSSLCAIDPRSRYCRRICANERAQRRFACKKRGGKKRQEDDTMRPVQELSNRFGRLHFSRILRSTPYEVLRSTCRTKIFFFLAS